MTGSEGPIPSYDKTIGWSLFLSLRDSSGVGFYFQSSHLIFYLPSRLFSP